MKKYIILILLPLFIVSCGEVRNIKMENKIMSDTEEGISDDTGISKGGSSTRAECIQGCYAMWKINSENKEKKPADMYNDCDNLCDAGQGIQNNNPSYCEKSEGILRNTCYSEIAQKTKDPTLCEKITEKLFLGSCYATLAEEMKDATLCEKIDEKIMKDICLESVQKK